MKSITPSEQYAHTILNSLSAHIAIIDEDGRILETNQAWDRFALSNQTTRTPPAPDINYLNVCENACGTSAENATAVAQGIRQVIQGEIDEYSIDYPCHSPDEKRWFYMRVTRAANTHPLKVVISHENITALKLAEEQLHLRESQLRQNAMRLEEANAALKAVLRQRDEDRSQLEQTIFQNVREGVLPNTERLKTLARSPEAADLIGLIEHELQQLASPFLRHLTSLCTILTPQELQIANLIKEGLSTKQIAELMKLSSTTIHFHRRNLRNKLHLTNTRTNLRTFLLSLTD